MGARRLVPVGVVVALAVGVGVLALTLRDSGGDNGGSGGEQRASASASTTSTTSTTPPTFATQATAPPTAPPATGAPTTTFPPGTVVVVPPSPPSTTSPPPSDTAATTTTTTATTTTTVAPIEAQRSTVVYSPPDAPRRKGDLVVPAEHGTTSLVLVHGGGGTTGSRRELRAWANAYADAGYVTLTIDYFLYRPTTQPPVYPRPQRDLKAAVQWLRLHASDLGIDPDAVVVQGFSAGAALAAEVYVSGDDPFYEGEGRYDGTSDAVAGLIGLYGSYGGEQADAEQYYGGTRDSADPEVQERLARADSVANTVDAGGPALLFHGDADDVIPLERTTLFGDALVDAGHDATVTVVEDAGHGFDRSRRGRLTPEGRAAFDEVLTWLEERFPGEER